MKACLFDNPMYVHRYYDGELDRETLARFEAHLPMCSSCRDTLASVTNLGDTLRQANHYPLPKEFPGSFAPRARDLQLQRSRRIAWGLLAAASFLLVSSLSFVGYSLLAEVPTRAVMTQWEEEVVSPPIIDEEFSDLTARTLVAIHMQDSYRSERGNE